MAKISKSQKYQTGGDVPKGYVKGEMTGRLYKKEAMEKHESAMADALDRQAGKGKYAPKKNDAIKNAAPKKKMKNGGSLSGLKAGNKRVGPVDAKGAWTKVQEKTLAKSKGKATLKKDKPLGATKMKMGGAMKKCKYGCK